MIYANSKQKIKKIIERLCFRCIREICITFRKDEAGDPIEFDALDYSLLKEEWQKKEKFR
ncbi:MAG: hypothetical protein JW776_14720 [Candidatus Lokiarchaeota archaeon]|nr:hypothetical protein [Candidatus Lokiarchaeota archaeon]